jgi:DNA polymerase-4/DNA polymerase V
MICHVDADAFFASVLGRGDPRLRGKPLLALGMGGTCVIAATYEAKAKGVKTGMHITEAVKLCPEALRVPSDFRETAIASHEIEGILGEQCPLLEQMSVDEWFLDLRSLRGGLSDDLHGWAKNLQQNILRRTSLSVSVGVAPTKLLSKMASEYKKPAGITVVAHATIEEFLHDRPAAAIPGIGKQRLIASEAHGWETAWDIAQADPEKIQKLFGKPGREIQLELLGYQVSPVTPESEPQKSISRARSFLRTGDRDVLWAHVLRHLEYVVLKMRREGLAARGLTVWLRQEDFTMRSESQRLPQLLDTEEQLRPYARHCFDIGYDSRYRYNQTGVALWNLRQRGASQYDLFEDPRNLDRSEKIQHTLDSLHARFGRESITRGAALPVRGAAKPAISLPIVEGAS